MPNLLFFAPCEKVIVDQNNTTSIIAILEEVKVQTIPGVTVPLNAVVPMQWAVLTLWEQASEWESRRIFEQRVSLLAANGNVLIDSVAEFTFEKQRHRVVAQIAGLPVSNPGMHKVRVAIREKTDDPKEWKEIASYSFNIELVASIPPAIPRTDLH